MQGGSKIKKFTHNRMKACLLRSEQEDKENLPRTDEFQHKKFSVQLPIKGPNVSDHSKSIFNEQISVTLNTSNHRDIYKENDLISVDIQMLNQQLGRQRYGVPLADIMVGVDVRSIEVRLLVERMLSCMKNQQKTSNSSMISEKEEEERQEWQLRESLLRPCIEKQTELLEQNLYRLVQERDNYLAMRTIGQPNKIGILNALKEMQTQQQAQLDLLS